MKAKRTKYDTNPLDGEVVRKTEEVWGQGDAASATDQIKGETRSVRRSEKESPRENVYSEAPTRRYDSPSPDAPYPSIFVPPTYAPPPEVYQPPPTPYQQPMAAKPTARSVTGLGIPEKWALVLPYAPRYIGLVAAIIELVLVPRKEVRVRAHAAQAMALHLSIGAIEILFGAVAAITGSTVGGKLFGLASFIFLIISMIRVWKGETHRIAPLAEPAEWLNKHIVPRNK
jgi:uncharacterized membrane protein